MINGMDEPVYKLSYNYTDFFNLDLDIEDLVDEFDENLGEDKFYNYSWDNISLKEYWVDAGAKFVDVGLKNAAKPDVTTWNGANLVLSPKAYEVLKGSLEPLGEFLPITIDGETYLVFNCLNVVYVDSVQSEADIVNDLWMGVKKIGFEDDTIKNNLIFKTKFDRCSALYCGESFKTLLESHNLKGLNFNEDLLASF